jgi:hypothetical protein
MNTIVTEAQITSIPIPPISRHNNIVDDDGALRSAFLAKTDGSGVCPTGFNVPTEAQLDLVYQLR